MTDSPLVDLSQFPIALAHPAGGRAALVRGPAICDAVARALGLPAAIRLDASAQYATLNYCSAGGAEATDYRVRINGFAFGQGAKKKNEYLSVSVLGLNGSEVVGWSEDVQKLGGSAADWAAFHAGKFPGRTSPPPKKGSPKDVALLTFVDAADAVTPITPEIRSLVSAKAIAAAPAPKKAQRTGAARSSSHA